MNYPPSPCTFAKKGDVKAKNPLPISAPFKSRIPRLGLQGGTFVGPGPADYFRACLTVDDLDPPVYPRYPTYFTFPPEPASFNCSQERFFDPRLFEECCCRPSPADYDVPSFTDLLWCECKRHEPAICNPKLGFLTSGVARPEHIFKFTKEGGFSSFFSDDDGPRLWRNMRPRKKKTYPYHGPPPKCPDSPGPIYDTNPAARAIKSRRDWWDPRHIIDIGFNVSGCTRNIELSSIDRNIAGPGTYYAVKPPKRCSTGTIKTTGPRTEARKISGPGPKYKLHDKTGSIWRGTHLGTFNIYLKGVDRQYPNAGGYHPRGNLDKLGDEAANIVRPDEYKEELCGRTN